MQRARILKEQIKVKETLFLALHLDTENTNFPPLSDGEDQMGILGVTLPQAEKMPSLLLSSVMIGDSNTISARFIAKCLKIALASMLVKTISKRELDPFSSSYLRKGSNESK
ncbi:MAG: hypothetical protein OEW62_03070 [Candidatus Bathyarchaeota archaeon]|nr:hypothetical protein [Candidatus Bathyarchaeota archaeon]MDH5746463.1 hypothetical protein [Candidatus Bathyarchaeota archaeon]